MVRKIVKPLNAYPWGGARTIKAQYKNSSLANFKHTGTWGATGVIEIIYGTEDNTNRTDMEERG